jgi:hypothetical protein
MHASESNPMLRRAADLGTGSVADGRKRYGNIAAESADGS